MMVLSFSGPIIVFSCLLQFNILQKYYYYNLFCVWGTSVLLRGKGGGDQGRVHVFCQHTEGCCETSCMLFIGHARLIPAMVIPFVFVELKEIAHLQEQIKQAESLLEHEIQDKLVTHCYPIVMGKGRVCVPILNKLF